MEALADGEYDAIVLGTGLKECVISGLLSVKGQRVLQVDRNSYYGGEGASLNLTTLFEKFHAGEPPESLGANREYNIDLIPKFIMATGNLTKCVLCCVVLCRSVGFLFNYSTDSLVGSPIAFSRGFATIATVRTNVLTQDALAHQSHALLGIQEHFGFLRLQGRQNTESARHAKGSLEQSSHGTL